MVITFKSLLQAGFFILALSFLCPAAGAADSKTPITYEYYTLVLGPSSAHQRLVTFPRDRSLGAIIISPLNFEDETGGRTAQGTLVVPPGQASKFVPGPAFYKDPSIIKTIDADSLDSIHFAASSLDEAEEGMCDRALMYVGHLKGLKELKLDRSDASDAGAAHAAELPNLQRISAFTVGLNGSCIRQFAGLKHLRDLRMAGNNLKEENLKYLAALPQLQYLSLNNCNIGDAGIKYLTCMTGLVSLHISENSRITDKSIPCLLALKKLRFLSIGKTSITPKAVLQLKSLPLSALELPSNQIPKDQYDAIARAFPGVGLTARGSRVRHVDADTKALWGPLH